MPPLREFALEFYYSSGAKKTSIMPLSEDGKFDDRCIHLDTIQERDGQTDGQICHNSIMLCMHSNNT